MPPNSAVGIRHASLRLAYAQNPLAALTRKIARSSSARIAASDPFHGEVQIGAACDTSLRFGLDDHVGGLNDAPNPGDLLCAALAACLDGAIRMVANQLGVSLTALEVEVSGELDARGCLGVDADVRVGFEALTCRVRLTAAEGTNPRRVDFLVRAAERSCVNLDSLRQGLTVVTTAEAVIPSANY
jgi:uncharacterized OsmC-like protein